MDIHTEEDATVWEKTALYFGHYGAHYTGPELREAIADDPHEYEGWNWKELVEIIEEL